MHFVYIIYSPSHNRFYTGETVNPHERVVQHNSGFYSGSSTSFTQDWELKLVLSVPDRAAGLKVERYIKAMKSKTFVQNLVNDPVFLANFKNILKQKTGVLIK
ncbi:MAG: GIY-YIG nuclease family protein [Bacteroidetes bacterium]|nr:GIY-YIG nuclease family protein [Bacteroidota bacterium]